MSTAEQRINKNPCADVKRYVIWTSHTGNRQNWEEVGMRCQALSAMIPPMTVQPERCFLHERDR